MNVSTHGISRWADAAAEPEWPEAGTEDSVARRFERIVVAAPDAVAFCSPAGDVISYGELNARANRLAHLIRERVDGTEDVVGLLARHPAVAITGMLAALKAGHVYAPLDPSDPPRRLEHIVADSTARLILSAPEHLALADRLAEGGGVVVEVGRDELGMPDIDLETEAAPTDPSYLLYTSGSTGTPKGVLHNHRNLLQKGLLSRTLLGIGRDDRVSLLFGPATGAATTGIFGPLLNGGAVYPYELKMHGLHRMQAWLNDRAITVLHIVPTVFRRFLDIADEDSTFPAMRLLVLPGEPLLRRDVELFRHHFGPEAVLAPRLSSTETSVVACDFLDMDSDVNDDVLSVGFPVGDKEIRLVDDSGQDVPSGSVGQIVVEGDYLALGYWGNPELSEEKFGVGRGGRRTYHMGDLGRFRDDGRLEFLGRVDDRLKINGVTIEPREVERALQRAGPFKEVAAVGLPGTDGGEQLVAYVVPENGSEVPENLRASLAELLPSPMIPSTFVAVAALPLTSLGKIDKRSLPDPQSGPSRSQAPRDELETQLVSIWTEVLAIGEIGITDDFFEIGGTSIQALQTFALIGKRLGVDVPSTTLLQAPTIAALAAVIREGEWESPQESLVVVANEGEATPFFCVHGGGGGVFFVRDLAAHLAGNRPVYGLQARGFEGHPGPYRPVEELAANYLEEVRTVQAHGPYLLGGLSFGGKVAFEMAQQLVAAREEVALVALLDTQAKPTEYNMGADRHVARLREMRPADKVSYVVKGASKRAARTGKRALVRFYLASQRPLPDTFGLRNSYFYPMHSKANRAYAPNLYPGRVAVIAAVGKTEVHENTWGRVSAGGFSTVEVAATHADLTNAPYVTEVAGHLQRFLDEADPKLVGDEAVS